MARMVLQRQHAKLNERRTIWSQTQAGWVKSFSCKGDFSLLDDSGVSLLNS
ncbi:uncharacterized protein CMC5_023250 [Chondromyces crocatus]|uniref:Uncharacterized protein n=1 Tax=Chondromyces crocatus TaxID=52 RepID=A0A0K1EBX7_CHOCO|nr:uncharacterized protein CMC5_023250 [Chondromyces crocatus]